MSNQDFGPREYKLGACVVLALVLIVGCIGYFMNRQATINKGAAVEAAQIEADKTMEVERLKADKNMEVERLKNEERTKRTQERWNSIPFFGRDTKKDKNDG